MGLLGPCILYRNWFAVRVFSSKEQFVSDHLTGRDIEIFLPKCKVKREWSDRTKTLTQALFSGYTFAHISIEESKVVLRTPGVIEILSLRGEPTVIEDGIIEALKSRTDERGIYQHGFKIGQSVRILEGPYAGFVGDLERCEGEERVMVLLRMLNGSTWHVNVGSDEVKAVTA